MKYLTTLFLLTFIWTSCTVDTAPAEQRVAGTWELMRTHNNIAGAPMNEDPEFEEFYVFKEDGSFIKTNEGESVLSASGTYKVLQADPAARDHVLNLELTFEAENSLIYHCGSRLQEYLVLTAEGVLFNSWIACDGFYMEYEKKS